MPFVSDDLYNEICMANDIVDYASSFLSLKKSGRSYMACCPFHNEKTPSFHIDRDKQLFHCFGCGASGNFVQLVMRLESLDYRDAIRLLAERANITIPESGIRQSSELSKKKDEIYEMNRIAARYFYDCLMKQGVGDKARAYFAGRKLSRETIIKFGLGYAPDEFDALVRYLTEKGYKSEDMVEAGLAIKTKNGKFMDKFRDRVMFPIINVRGKVIGFGGRIMAEKTTPDGRKLAKYLNTAETIVFDKGSNLFALNLAKSSNAPDLILCEGYMDVISVHQAGIKNCVATLGTAITDMQAKLMLRYGREILICYDMDEAGTKAALRAIDIIAAAGGKSRIIRISGAKDPDEYIRKYGVSGFKKAIEKALPSTEFRLSLVKGKYNIADTDGKIRFVEEAAEILAGLDDPVEVEAYIKRTSADTGISAQSIFGKYTEIRNSARRRAPVRTKEDFKKREINLINREKPPEKRVTSAVLEAEKRLFSIIARSRRLCIKAFEIISPDDFSNDTYKLLAKRIKEYADSGKNIDESLILNEFSGDAAAENMAAAVFFNTEEYSDDTKTLYDLIYTIKNNKLKARMNAASELKEISEIMKEQEKLEQDRKQWGKGSQA